MEYQICVDNQIIDVVITYKRIKAIYMKVEDGKIKVSAPIGTSLSFIEQTLFKHKDRLFHNVLHYESHYDYQDNGYVSIFDKVYTIKVIDMKQRKCSIHEQYLYVYHADIQKTIEIFLKDVLNKYIEKRINDYLKSDFKLKHPDVEIKKYKRRWGCCFVLDNKVSFNLSLVHLNQELIDYVIVHELTHFLVPNHSQKFYNEMSKRMKDYKHRQKRLKEMHI